METSAKDIEKWATGRERKPSQRTGARGLSWMRLKFGNPNGRCGYLVAAAAPRQPGRVVPRPSGKAKDLSESGAEANPCSSSVRGAQPPRLRFGAPSRRTERLTPAPNGSSIPRLTISREGAADCARGGRAPHSHCMDSAEARAPPTLRAVRMRK